MSLPSQAEYVIVGAGIHGLSTAWRLAERLTASGESVEGRIVIVDKADRIAAGATGIACGVVRNNYFQPAMRKLMAHSVSIWESDPEAFSYHANGYMQISCEKMREDVKQIHAEQKAIGYESVFIEGEEESREYMLNLFDDWQAQGITSVLHEKPGGYANNVKAMEGLSKKVFDLGVNVVLNTEVKGFVNLLLAAGGDTTDKAIGNMWWFVLQNPDQLAELKRDPSLWDRAFTEMMRYDPPVHAQGRRTQREIAMYDQVIPNRGNVTFQLGAANRDERVFKDPDKFDIFRKDLYCGKEMRVGYYANGEASHLGFGLGKHFCVGYQMARAEAVIGTRLLLETLKNIRIKSGKNPIMGTAEIMRSIPKLEVEYERR